MPGTEVLDLLGQFFFNAFGNAFITGAVLLGVFVMIMVILRAPLSAILVVLAGLVVGLVTNVAYTNLIEIPAYIIIIIFLMLGSIFALFFYFYIRG